MIQHVPELTAQTYEDIGAGDHEYFRLSVSNNLLGQEVYLPLHVVRGAHDGPTLGMVSVLHGNETPPIRVLADLLREIEPAELQGTLIFLPVANPVAFARDKRNTPEMDIDFANINRIFPGRRETAVFGEGESSETDRTFTEMLAATIVERVLPLLDYLVEFHCHAEGCALSEVIVAKGEDPVARESQDLAKAFGWGLIHEETLPDGSLSAEAASTGIPSFAPEIGGSGHGTLEDTFVDIQVAGLKRVFSCLDMYDTQLKDFFSEVVLFRQCPKTRPTTSGYLLTEFPPEAMFATDDVGVKVQQGQRLGTILDPYSLEVIEELEAAADGYLYLTRKTGIVQAGNHAYGVASLTDARRESLR